MITISWSTGTYVDMGSCPHHILGESLKNVLNLNVKPWKWSIFEYCPHQLWDKLGFSTVCSNTFWRPCFRYKSFFRVQSISNRKNRLSEVVNRKIWINRSLNFPVLPCFYILISRTAFFARFGHFPIYLIGWSRLGYALTLQKTQSLGLKCKNRVEWQDSNFRNCEQWLWTIIASHLDLIVCGG